MSQMLIMFWEFFKIGLFAIGGGMATIPFLYELAEKYPWFSAEMVTDMIAVAESTPGPIGINMATYAGFSAGGIIGGLAATVGLVLPSLIIILMIAGALNKFEESFYVQSAFYGVRPAAAALITLAGIEVFKASILNLNAEPLFAAIDLRALTLFVIIFIVSALNKRWHPLIFIAAAAVAGIITLHSG